MKKTNTENKLTFKVTRAKEFKKVVYFDLLINDLVNIYGCKVIEGKNGDFIAFPSYKATNDKYYNHAYVQLSDEDTHDILKMVEDLLDK